MPVTSQTLHRETTCTIAKLWRERTFLINAVKLLKYNMMIKDFDMDIVDGWVNQ